MTRPIIVRAAGLLIVAIALIAAMVVLGLWQYHVYDNHQRADALATMRLPPIPLDSALGPDQAFPTGSVGVPVSMVGYYERSSQLYVRGPAGAEGRFAVVTPLVTATGSAILVLRGAAAHPDASTPAGTVRLTGILEPSQTGGTALDRDRVTDAISIASLVGSVDHDLYGGYVVLSESAPADALTPVSPPLPDPSRWAGIRNLAYALQWWVFAAFVAFMWWRIVADMHAAEAGRGVGAEGLASGASGNVAS